MKNSRISKGGIILLSLTLIVGMFSAIALADNNGTNGMNGGLKEILILQDMACKIIEVTHFRHKTKIVKIAQRT